LVRGKFPFEPQDVEILRHTYGSGVQYLDESLGTLFDTLRRSGMWDQMLIVVTSDHGEEFIEHGGLGHKTLYDEILRVPLLIKWPDGDRAGVENRMPCSAVDLAPTLLEFAGLPAGDLPGTPLHRRGKKVPVFAGTLDRAVVADGYKAIFGYPEIPPLLFHLTDDPGELTNLAVSEADRLRTLEEIMRTQNEEALALYRRIGSGSESGEVVLSRLERERLEAFGYVVTPSSPAPAAPPP
jgi:arylsulfatase A-like enzyme